MALTLESPAYEYGNEIPDEYTCDGANISPPLTWNEVPADTKSFVLIFEDPDAPFKTWVHWLLYNIPGEKRMLDHHISATAILKTGAMHGINDFKKYGYGGPCPPSGRHRYFMRLYALNIMLSVKPGLTKPQLMEAMQAYIIENAELMGTYERK